MQGCQLSRQRLEEVWALPRSLAIREFEVSSWYFLVRIVSGAYHWKSLATRPSRRALSSSNTFMRFHDEISKEYDFEHHVKKIKVDK